MHDSIAQTRASFYKHEAYVHSVPSVVSLEKLCFGYHKEYNVGYHCCPIDTVIDKIHFKLFFDYLFELLFHMAYHFE